jgi:tetratricopeptide (TPR) repeat protein
VKTNFSILLICLLFLTNSGYSQSVEEYYNRGIMKCNNADYQGAIFDFTMVIKNNPKLAIAYYNRGIAKRRLDDFSGAISDFTLAINIDPKDAEFYYNRGEAKFQFGQKESGCLDFSKAEKLGSDDASKAKRKYCQ